MVPAFPSPTPAPYGAAELKRVARPYLVRAILTGSTSWALATVVMGFVIAALPRSPGEVPRAFPVEYRVLLPQIREPIPKFRLPPAPPAAQPAAGEVKAVPESKAPPDVTVPVLEDATAPARADASGGGRVVSIAPAGEGPATEALPRRGEPYYVEELPELVRDVRPVYPEIAEMAGVTGTVVVHVLVGRDGHVVKAEVEPSRSIPMLDAAALDAARQLVFKPALVNGRPVAVWIARTYRFTLH